MNRLRSILCALRGHPLVVFRAETLWWWCRCGAEGESQEYQDFAYLLRLTH